MQYDVTPPLPITPASFVTASSGYSASSPRSFPSTSILGTTADPQLAPTKAKSTWKRGIEKIFRSKSSAALRDAFVSNENRPPVPVLPNTFSQKPKNPLGKPFSASTPPSALMESHRNTNSFRDLLSPTSARSEAFVFPSHPSLPMDPFASSLDLSSNKLPSTPIIPGYPGTRLVFAI
jgi:hypothetical protein